MADGRMLRRRIAHDKKLARLSCDRARLLFTWCIAFLDVEGRMTGDPEIIKVDVFPFVATFDAESIARDIAELDVAGLVQAYEVDGEACLFFPGFAKNQSLRKEREGASRIPPPPPRTINPAVNSGPPLGVLRDNSGSAPAEDKINQGKGSEDKVSKGHERRRTKSVPDEYGEIFLRFWARYPRSDAKRSAWEIWQRGALDRQIDRILDDIRTRQWSADKKYIPYASTYLKQRRWEDDAPPALNTARERESTQADAIVDQLSAQEAECSRARAAAGAKG